VIIFAYRLSRMLRFGKIIRDCFFRYALQHFPRVNVITLVCKPHFDFVLNKAKSLRVVKDETPQH
jgi:hypothetical protein